MPATTWIACSPPTTWSRPTTCSSPPPGSPTANWSTACGTCTATRPLTRWSCAPAPGRSGASRASTSSGSSAPTRRSSSTDRGPAAAKQAEPAGFGRRADDDLAAEDHPFHLDDRHVGGGGRRRAAAPAAEYRGRGYDHGHPVRYDQPQPAADHGSQ